MSNLNEENDLIDLISDDQIDDIIQVKRLRRKKEKIDAALLDFDLTYTKKDELISAKFSETFKSILEQFPITKPDDKRTVPEAIKHNESYRDFPDDRKVNSWVHKMESSNIKSKLKILTNFKQSETKVLIKSNLKETNSKQRPKTALSNSNSSITSVKLNKRKQPVRPLSTKLESNRHVSNLLFNGYEKLTQENSKDLYEDDTINYISPSFRIKKYNLETELELAKNDLFKRYAVFNEPVATRPKSNRMIRFQSATRVDFLTPIKTI